MAPDRELTRKVKISHPEGVDAEVVLESVPVYLDFGWTKVEDEDYGPYADLAETRTLEAGDGTAALLQAQQAQQAQQAAARAQRASAEDNK